MFLLLFEIPKFFCGFWFVARGADLEDFAGFCRFVLAFIEEEVGFVVSQIGEISLSLLVKIKRSIPFPFNFIVFFLSNPLNTVNPFRI